MFTDAPFINAPFINMSFDPVQPYNELPLLPPLCAIETPAVLKACVPAHAALAAYRQCLLQSPIGSQFTGYMLQLDAVGAAQLSGIPVPALETLQQSDHAVASEVSRYLKTADSASRALAERPLSSSLALDLAGALSTRDVSVRRRRINQSESAGLDSAYRPPVGAERIHRLLDNWQGYIESTAGDTDPLVLLALAHYQFMATRPFTFGNISTAQLINTLFLQEEDLLQRPCLPLALYFSLHAQRYWHTLHAVSAQQRWQEWLLFVLGGIATCANDMTQRLMALHKYNKQLVPHMRKLLPKNAAVDQIAPVCSKPGCTISDLVSTGVVRRQTASTYLHILVQAGLLTESSGGKEKRFNNKAVLNLLLGAGG